MARGESHRQYRSAVDGKYVKKSYATQHPSSTVGENVPNPGHGTEHRGKKK